MPLRQHAQPPVASGFESALRAPGNKGFVNVVQQHSVLIQHSTRTILHWDNHPRKRRDDATRPSLYFEPLALFFLLCWRDRLCGTTRRSAQDLSDENNTAVSMTRPREGAPDA